MRRILNLIFVLIVVTSLGQTISQPIELPNMMDGKMISITPGQGCQGVVVIFTDLNCPYDQHYQDRIKALSEKYASRISFFLINANPTSEQDEIKLKVAYQKWDVSIPYLSDKKQIAVAALNAKKTPEAVLLKPMGNGLNTIYLGAIDDNPQVHHDTGNNFLDEAIQSLLAGQAPKVASERVIGCTIRKAQ